MNSLFKKSYPLSLLFLVILIFVSTSNNFLTNNSIDPSILFYANILLFIISMVSFSIQTLGLKNTNPNVFIRSVIGSMMIKMFVVVIAVLIYVNMIGNNFNKRGIFIALLLYLFYLAAEVFTVMKMNKK